jgi:hypothetical protein
VRKQGLSTSLYDSHPIDSDRVAAAQQDAAALPQVGDDGRTRYRAAIRPHLGAWLKDDLRRRDYGQTLFLIDRLAQGGEDPGLLGFYRGESFRLRRLDGDAQLAEAAYASAAAYPDAPPAAFRELGELKRKRGDTAGAREAFNAYLKRAPQAEDAWLVQDSLNSLGE